MVTDGDRALNLSTCSKKLVKELFGHYIFFFLTNHGRLDHRYDCSPYVFLRLRTYETTAQLGHSQYVREHADRPHVRVEADGVVLHHFGGGELCRRRRHLDDALGVEFCGETEVDDLHVRAVVRLAENVFRL